MEEDVVPDLNRRIAERVRELRAAKGLSLDALAARSGVSRSMISLIERGESSATAVVLEKLAKALGVILPSLFEASAVVNDEPLARRDAQPVWRDPGSGYLRRSVSPRGRPQPMQIVEIEFPPGGRVVLEAGLLDVPMHQQIWVLDGTLEVAVDGEPHRLETGDCLAMEPSSLIHFHNPTRKTTRYAVVVATEAPAKR